MGFPKDKIDDKGLSNKTGVASPQDPNSNINWQKGGQRIGVTAGRLKFGKQNISTLNKGESGQRESFKKTGV